MPYIGRISTPAPTLDHQSTAFDATEELILLGQDHAFVKKDDRIIGIVCLDNLLEGCMRSWWLVAQKSIVNILCLPLEVLMQETSINFLAFNFWALNNCVRNSFQLI
jgi:hypothetical protein